MNVMQSPGMGLAYGTVPGAPRSDKTFLWSSPEGNLAEKYCNNPKVPGAQLKVNSARTITWLVGVTIYCRPTFFNNNLPPLHQFLCNKILLKKISRSKGNAHETNF